MKVTYRIPTEMYSYVEVEYDLNGTFSSEEMKEVYDGLTEAFKLKPKNSLGDKEFNTFIDKMLQGEPNHVEEYNLCSPEQQKIIQTIKRALKRAEARNGIKDM